MKSTEQKKFEQEGDCLVRLTMIKQNKSLATQENFENEKSYLVRNEIIKKNPLLATRENYNKEQHISTIITMLSLKKKENNAT